MSKRHLVDQAKSWDELLRIASFEQGGDEIFKIRKFGQSASLTANTPEDVWFNGGTKVIQTTAETVNLVSDSANDTSAGTGAQFVSIAGLDADYNPQTEIIVTNGTTPVNTTNTYITVNRMLVAFAGSGRTNAGALTLTGNTSGDVHALCPAGQSITQQSHFTIPAGYTAFTTSIVLSVYRSSGGSGTRRAEVDTMVYSPPANTQYQTLRYGITNDGGPLVTVPPTPSQTPERTTLWFRATAATTGTIVTSSQEILMIKGDYNIRSEF